VRNVTADDIFSLIRGTGSVVDSIFEKVNNFLFIFFFFQLIKFSFHFFHRRKFITLNWDSNQLCRLWNMTTSQMR
jgi:hypothetical protein